MIAVMLTSSHCACPFIQMIAVAPVFLFLVIHIFVLQMLLCSSGGAKAGRCNTLVGMDKPKVVNFLVPEFKVRAALFRIRARTHLSFPVLPYEVVSVHRCVRKILRISSH